MAYESLDFALDEQIQYQQLRVDFLYDISMFGPAVVSQLPGDFDKRSKVGMAKAKNRAFCISVTGLKLPSMNRRQNSSRLLGTYEEALRGLYEPADADEDAIFLFVYGCMCISISLSHCFQRLIVIITDSFVYFASLPGLA